MTPFWHRIYIGAFIAIGFTTLLLLIYWGASYYGTDLLERPFHDDHRMLKPSGPIGHGLGILGTLMILVGVFSYILRKKRKLLPRFGALKYWLEFHIFLCSVGPLLILFHTAFKFGGIVSVSFWSMVAVVLSGVIGRFIYIQIPRTIQGRELSLAEIREMRDQLSEKMRGEHGLSEQAFQQLKAIIAPTSNIAEEGSDSGAADRGQIKSRVKAFISEHGLRGQEAKGVMRLVNNELKMNGRIRRLQTMQKLFKYWHVAHLPFALIMLIIMVIHVIVTITFGYRWIF